MSPFSHFLTTDPLILLLGCKYPAAFVVFRTELRSSLKSLPYCDSTEQNLSVSPLTSVQLYFSLKEGKRGGLSEQGQTHCGAREISEVKPKHALPLGHRSVRLALKYLDSKQLSPA